MFEKAVEYLSGDMDVEANREYLEAYADKVIFVYENKKDFMDLDFWIRIEQLVDEPLSYDEFMSINSVFDGDPFDVEFDDTDTINQFKKVLYDFKHENKGVDGLIENAKNRAVSSFDAGKAKEENGLEV